MEIGIVFVLAMLFAMIYYGIEAISKGVKNFQWPEKEHREMYQVCPCCAKSIKVTSNFCRYCGKDVSSALPRGIVCPHCDEELELSSEERFERKFICPVCKKEIIVTSNVVGRNNNSNYQSSQFRSTYSSNSGKDISDYGINEIKSSGRFSPKERAAEYRRRGKSPSGVIDGVYNDSYRGNDSYNDADRDWDADA